MNADGVLKGIVSMKEVGGGDLTILDEERIITWIHEEVEWVKRKGRVKKKAVIVVQI